MFDPKKFKSIVDSHLGDNEIHEPDFIYSKALDALREWDDFSISESEIETLACLIKDNYDTFKASTDLKIKQIKDILFNIIAYCDSKAAEKNIRNKYADHRVVAHSSVRQNDWCLNLLKYKLGRTDYSGSFKNLLHYLSNPEHEWPILSNKHRQWIWSHFIGGTYNPAKFSDSLLNKLGYFYKGVSSANATTFLTRIIYEVNADWQAPEIIGLFSHDADNAWKKELEKELSTSETDYSCIWWHKKIPYPLGEEIYKLVEKQINNGETVLYYYIRNNRAYYCAEIAGIATSEKDYNAKKNDWIKYNPYWYNEDFAGYNDGEKSAAVVFLIKGFRRLHPEIDISRFKRYKDMNYNVRTGMAAISHIITEHEMKQQGILNQYIPLLEANYNIILTGAPGTGKTYLANKIAKAITDSSTEEQEKERIQQVQFHPSYDYTDFVEGLRPDKNLSKEGHIGFTLTPGVFKSFCAKAIHDQCHKYVFIIDEINRGELSKIFGELFFAIDPGYRGKVGRIQTQYQNLITEGDFAEGFYIPQNVYIIGTMNDIDRGVESMDFAVRRRFAWQEVTAADSEIILDNIGQENLREEALQRMRRLNTAISECEYLNEAYHIGGAYFLKVEKYAAEDPFRKLWQYHLKGLLAEYLRGMHNADSELAKLKDAYNGNTSTDGEG